MRNLSNAFMKLFTEYGVLAWGRAPKTHLVKIDKSLNKAVRIKLFQGKCTVTVKYQAIAVKVHEKVDPLSAPIFHTRVFTYHIRASINNTSNTREFYHYFIRALKHGTMFLKIFKSVIHQ